METYLYKPSFVYFFIIVTAHCSESLVRATVLIVLTDRIK